MVVWIRDERSHSTRDHIHAEVPSEILEWTMAMYEENGWRVSLFCTCDFRGETDG
jgi:hypothetical protein